jgi:hypothetical protein
MNIAKLPGVPGRILRISRGHQIRPPGIIEDVYQSPIFASASSAGFASGAVPRGISHPTIGALSVAI